MNASRFSGLFSLVLMILVPFAVLASGPSSTLTPQQAVEQLVRGNMRYVAGKAVHPNAGKDRRLATEKGQAPYATILACSDSRVPVEILFDQGVGDLFVIKVAGNVADTDEIGTAEYGTDHLGTPLLLVLGHNHCGAVTAVVKGAEVHGSIPKLVDNIVPAAAKVKKEQPGLGGEDLINAAIKQNVWQSVEDLLTKSPAIAERVKAGKLSVEGAVYDIATGKVQLLGTHPKQFELVK